jgi:hypothetical protein
MKPTVILSRFLLLHHTRDARQEAVSCVPGFRLAPIVTVAIFTTGRSPDAVFAPVPLHVVSAMCARLTNNTCGFARQFSCPLKYLKQTVGS